MKRFGLFVLVLGLTTLSNTQGDDKKEAKFDPAKIVGNWTITSGSKYGDGLEKKSTEGLIVIDKEKIQIKEGDKVEHEMTYKIDATKTPAHIDMKGTVGPAKDLTVEGLIDLHDGTLKLVYSFPGEKRPTKFESKKDSKDLYFEMKAVKK
jgi:uncharacterized protein (TIGR03067 family)